MDIAHGEINVGLNDRATPELRRIEAEYKAAMARIDRMEASAKIKADVSEIERDLKKARDEVRILDGMRASPSFDADDEDFQTAYTEALAKVKRLDGEKATIEIKTRGAEVALAKMEALTRAEAARAKAQEKYGRDQERAAQRASEFSRKAEFDAARQQERLQKLNKEYANLTDKIERLDKRRTPFGTEAKAKLEVDRAGALASLERVKAEMKVLGGHPPVHIKVDTDRTDMGRIRRTFFNLRDTAANIMAKVGNKLSNVGDIRIFGNNLRTIVGVAATLSPMLISLAGSATALVGVLGTGLAGAAAVSGGALMGLALNFGGVFAAMKPALTEFKTATQATQAYQKAVLKYGESSKQAKTAQEQMNSVLKQVDPNVRRAAIGMADLSTHWQKLTGGTAKRDLGKILAGGIKTASALMPTLARNTNQTFDIITARAEHFEAALRKPANVKMFDSLGKSANQFLAPALAGLGHLGAAFAHIGESAARIFAGPAGRGFEKWAADIDKATQPGAKLDASIRRIGHHATDLLHFFAALGRLLTTVFNGGADSGDRLVVSMTRALDRWNEFLKANPKSMSDFFRRSEADVRALWGALGPLIAAFVQWANLLAPFATGLLKGIGFVSKLVAGFTDLVGLGGPLTALGATIGAAFAVSKIGAFLGMLSRVVTLLREAYAVSRAGGILAGANALRQGAGGILGGRAGMAQGGAAAGAEIRAAMVSGGAAAAAEIRGAMATGGAAAGAEGAAASRLIPAGGAAAVAGETAAVTSLTTALGIAGGAVFALEGGIYLLGKALGQGKNSADALKNSMDFNIKTSAQATEAYNQLRGGISEVGSSYAHTRLTLEQARKALDGTKKGTIAHKMALLDYRDAVRQNIQARQQWIDTSHKMQAAAETEASTAQKSVTQNEKAADALRQRIRSAGRNANPADIANLKKLEAEHDKLAATASAAWNRVAAAPLNAQRAFRGMIELTGAAEQAVGKLARQAGGKEIATKISLKFEDPQKAGRVAQQASSALKAGVGKGAVMKIIADSSNADQAIRRLRAAKIEAKRIPIRAEVGAALAAIAAVKGIKLTPKILRLLHQGDPSVIAAVKRIVGINIPNKTLRVLGNVVDAIHKHGIVASLPNIAKLLAIAGHDGASGVWRSVVSAIGGFGPVQKVIEIVTHRRGKATGGIVLPAEKNIPFAENDPAYRQAAMRSPQRTRGGIYSSPTLLVGEENRSEYVIATNPVYRQQNRDYLMAAASDLGMTVVEAARRGKRRAHSTRGGQAASPSTPGVAGTRGQAAALGVPDPYSVGAVPVDDVEAAVSKFDEGVQKQHALVKSLTTTMKGIHVPKKGKARAAALARKHDYQRHIHAATAGGQWRNLTYRPLKTLDREDRDAKSDLGHLKHFNEQIKLLNTRISNDRTRMATAANMYSRTGERRYLESYNTWKGDRSDALKALIGEDGNGGLLGTARSQAGALAAKFPTDSMLAWVEELGGQIADAQGDQSDLGGPDPTYEIPKMTLDDFIGTTGRSGELANLLRDYALSQVNDAQDNPATPYVNENIASLADNQSSAAAVRDFYGSLLSQAQAAGAPADVVADAANAFTSARDTWQGISDTITGGAAQAAANQASDQTNYTSARADLFAQMGSNFAPIWAQTGTPPVGGRFGYGGAGQQNAVQPNTTQVSVINNFTEPPPDPHTWSSGLSWELQAAV